MNRTGKIRAMRQPDGDGHQVTYETSGSRQVHQFPRDDGHKENPPRAAGSYHDPLQHHKLMERVENYIRGEA